MAMDLFSFERHWMEEANSLALGIVLGIIMIWVGVIIALASRPLANGEANPRNYNYRPWQPKFVKRLSDEQVDMIGKKFARYAIWCGLLMIVLGIISLSLGIIGYGSYALYLFAIPIAILFILIIYSYTLTFRVSQQVKRP